MEVLAAQGTDQIDAVIKEVIATMERGRGQLLAIADDARQQFEEFAQELARVKEEAARQVDLVDRLEREDRRARAQLLQVSENMSRYTEDQIRAAYDLAREARVRLQVAREREALLRRERDALELRLKRLRETVRRAEDLVNSVGLAFQVITGKLKDLAGQVEGLQRRGRLLATVIKAQEEERRRVAREIHDGPAQSLANLVLRLEVCEKLMESDLERARSEVENLKKQLRDSLQEVRRIIFDLRPLALDDLGLIPALRAYLDGIGQRTGLQVAMRVLGEERRLPSPLEVTLFRLVQEAVSNVWKHARAATVSVKVEFLPDRVNAIVEDDGLGFDVAAAGQDDRHFGLAGMRERVALVDGSLEIESQPGRGTRVSFVIPVPREEGE